MFISHISTMKYLLYLSFALAAATLLLLSLFSQSKFPASPRQTTDMATLPASIVSKVPAGAVQDTSTPASLAPAHVSPVLA